MSALEEIRYIAAAIGLPVESGVFHGKAPDAYVVLTPLSEQFAFHADNQPEMNIEEVRIALFDKGNYNEKKRRLVQALLAADFVITDRRYIEHGDIYENDAGYHHYDIDAAKAYEFTTEED